MDRNLIDKLAQSPEDRLLLAKLWDKLNAGVRRNIPAHTGFLSPRELSLARYLFGNQEGFHIFGGYDEAERCMYIYLPEYLDRSCLLEDDSPIVSICATFYKDESPTHRDFLGALLGCGIDRQCIGDILVGDRQCIFFVTEEISQFILQNFEKAGRTSLQLTAAPLSSITIPAQQFTQIQDTVASVRLDSVIASGFRISRAAALEYITSGRAAINGLFCDKPDKTVNEQDKISVRGLGKLKLHHIGHTTKKGRISLTIHRYE